MHDLASADSRDIPRAACFESKAPTCLAFLLLNLPGLLGYSAPGSQAGMKQARLGARGSARAAPPPLHPAPPARWLAGGHPPASQPCLCGPARAVPAAHWCSRGWLPSWLWAPLAAASSSSAPTQ